MKNSSRILVILMLFVALASVYGHQFSHELSDSGEHCVLCQIDKGFDFGVTSKEFSFARVFSFAKRYNEIFSGYNSQIQSHHKTRAPPLFLKG